MTIMYDFDRLIDRRGTNSLKWEGESLPMWIADMDFPTAPAVWEAVKRRAEHPVFGYTAVPSEWYRAVSGWWRERHGFPIREDRLIFTTGVVPAVSCLVKRLTNHGDNVAAITPVYDIFFHSVENAGRHVLECPMRYENGRYRLDFGDLERVLSHPLTTLLILCNPHNPVGKLWTGEELKKIGELAEKHGVTVLSDEIHCDLTRPGTEYVPFAAVSPLNERISLTCLSASKAFNLAGLQSAAVFTHSDRLFAIAERGLNSDEVAEPNCFAAEAAVAAFTEGGQWLDELRAYLFENRAFAAEFLAKKVKNVSLTEGEATYLLWIDCNLPDTLALSEALREETGLRLSYGGVYRGNGARFLRMNIACPRARLEDGLSRFAGFMKDHSERS